MSLLFIALGFIVFIIVPHIVFFFYEQAVYKKL